MENSKQALDWAIIESSMATFRPASFGFTKAKRGFLTLPDGRTVFIKIGTDDATRKWAQKEVDVYRFLASEKYAQIPKLLSVNSDNSGFALECLGADDGWEWNAIWTEPRLERTIEAMDSLAALGVDQLPESVNKIRMMNEIGNSWRVFMEDADASKRLRAKLEKVNRQDIADEVCKSGFFAQDFHFSFPQDVLVHYDVRHDNCAWNAKTEQVKLVDWNWLQLGNREIDVNSLLVSVVKSGFGLPSRFVARLDRAALMWLAGAWFSACIQPIDSNSSEADSLRDYQLESAIAAYQLATKL